MRTYPVAEWFTSINGEGTHAGELAVFIRLRGCNLQCSYCDTRWANQPDGAATAMTAAAICETVRKTGIRNVTLTGGEPLLHASVRELLQALGELPDIRIEIETNGSIDLTPFQDLVPRPSFTMDYKLPGSGMEAAMCLDNFALLQQTDTVKFVAGSQEDLKRALELIQCYRLPQRCHVYLSPVFGKIDPADMVEFMKQHRLNAVRLQLQMHKFIWDPNQKGV